MTQKPSRSTTRSTRSAVTSRERGRVVETRRNRSWLWILGALGLIALPILIFVFANNGQVGPIGDITGVQTFAGITAGHQNGTVAYEQTPPAGGPHNPVWQNCGTYNNPITNENAVHSLEHGTVWVTYRPDLPADQVEQLKSLIRGRTYTLLSPYPNLPSPVVASAWGVQLKVDSAADPRLPQFIAKYRQGEQSPEPGAACTGGTYSSAQR